ncbi:biotin synthase [Sarracenia purpurea var. burkii]
MECSTWLADNQYFLLLYLPTCCSFICQLAAENQCLLLLPIVLLPIVLLLPILLPMLLQFFDAAFIIFDATAPLCLCSLLLLLALCILLQVSEYLFSRPLLCLRIAESCLMALEKGLLKSDTTQSDRSQAKEAGSTRFCMGAAWRETVGRKSNFNQILEYVKEIRNACQ